MTQKPRTSRGWTIRVTSSVAVIGTSKSRVFWVTRRLIGRMTGASGPRILFGPGQQLKRNLDIYAEQCGMQFGDFSIGTPALDTLRQCSL
jgi:hypothetical protein